MPPTARSRATYEDLCSLPDNVVGEIVNGELVTTPRPSPRHALAASGLGGAIWGPFQGGKGGPGGWWILDEPEVKLGEQFFVPDLAGWKKERLPSLPEENWISTPPNWVCEVLSPKTLRLDKTRKMPVYAEFGVSHLWLLDPLVRTLEVFRLETGKWLLLSIHGEAERVRAEPFDELEIELSLLWA